MATIANDKEFLNKNDKHLACVLMFDVSGSMNAQHGRPIQALNRSLKVFKEAFKDGKFGDDDAKNEALGAVDLCIMSFGGKTDESGNDVSNIQILQKFTPATEMSYNEELTAYGGTPLAEAVEKAMILIEEIKAKYRKGDIDYYRPILICITDGESTETQTEDGEKYYNSVKDKLHEAVKDEHLVSYGFGVGNCDMRVLEDFFGKVKDYTNQDFDDSFMKMLNLLGRSFVVKDNPTENPDVVVLVEEEPEYL